MRISLTRNLKLSYAKIVTTVNSERAPVRHSQTANTVALNVLTYNTAISTITNTPSAVSLSWQHVTYNKPNKLGHTDHKSLRVAAMICDTVINRHTYTQTVVLLAQPAELINTGIHDRRQ